MRHRTLHWHCGGQTGRGVRPVRRAARDRVGRDYSGKPRKRRAFRRRFIWDVFVRVADRRGGTYIPPRLGQLVADIRTLVTGGGDSGMDFMAHPREARPADRKTVDGIPQRPIRSAAPGGSTAEVDGQSIFCAHKRPFN